MAIYYVTMTGIPQNSHDTKKDIRYFHFESFELLMYFLSTFEIPNCYYHYIPEISYREI